LNVEVDFAPHGIFGVGDGLCPVASIVIEHQVDRQPACAEHEARTNVFACEAEPFDPRAGIVCNVGESNREGSLLSNAAAWHSHSRRSQTQKRSASWKKRHP
jgi:hypothetical protein